MLVDPLLVDAKDDSLKLVLPSKYSGIHSAAIASHAGVACGQIRPTVPVWTVVRFTAGACMSRFRDKASRQEGGVTHLRFSKTQLSQGRSSIADVGELSRFRYISLQLVQGSVNRYVVRLPSNLPYISKAKFALCSLQTYIIDRGLMQLVP